MINYYKTAYGLKLLFRVGGSCVYRSFVPGIFCLGTVLLIRFVWRQNDPNFDDDEIAHPYVTGVVIASLNFLLVFRVQIGYARYWEAAGAVFQFLSRMMDTAVHSACYHMQCDHYDHIKPPSYYDYPELNQFNLTRARERYRLGKGGSQIRLQHRAVGKSIESVHHSRVGALNWYHAGRKKKNHTAVSLRRNSATAMHGSKAHDPTTLEGAARLDGNYGKLFDDGKATFYDPANPEKLDACGFAGVQGGRTPPLFLQELAHLTSLCTAVALSTLRNDSEGAESPLDIYVPGSKWPDVDPNMSFFANYSSDNFGFNAYQKLKFFLGQARTFEERTSYNASHPLPVLGGVSDGEIRFLQQARGPYAKTQLCWYWLSEFISREHLAGSFGNIGPPIISRIMQFLGDADVQYNHARKIMFIPFPFVHAQLSVVYTLVAIPIVALLFEQYCEDVYIGCVFGFLTMTVLAAVHEVAREMENPFRNIPNELPLVTLQAQFNEALITMYSGYHPDAYWADEAEMYKGRVHTFPEAFTGDQSSDIKVPSTIPEENGNNRTGGGSSSGDSGNEGYPSDLKQLLEQMRQDMERQKAEMERQKLEIERLNGELLRQDNNDTVVDMKSLMSGTPTREKAA